MARIGGRGRPDPFALNYVRGQFSEFIAYIALSGYASGKWPVTPFTGQIVRQNQHRVLEIMATLYQFNSAAAAAQFVAA